MRAFQGADIVRRPLARCQYRSAGRSWHL